MKKLTVFAFSILFLAGISLQAKTTQLKSFAALFDALKAGETVRAVFYYKECKLISDNEEAEKSPDAVGGMELDNFEYFAANAIRNKNAFIAISKTVLINHPSYDFVENYIKVRIYDDGKVRIIAQYLAPNTHEIKMDESFYTQLNNGENKGAAYFYIQE